MDIKTASAALNYAAARPATVPDPNNATPSALGLVQDFAATMQQNEQIALSSMTSDVDPHALVQALAQTELAVETAVTLRDRVVEAYQEILRMPV
jgi:flagellar hook-basal body complex protein FliE